MSWTVLWNGTQGPAVPPTWMEEKLKLVTSVKETNTLPCARNQEMYSSKVHFCGKNTLLPLITFRLVRVNIKWKAEGYVLSPMYVFPAQTSGREEGFSQ